MSGKSRGDLAAEARRQRAEEALKANLRRRKEQARARKAEAVPAQEPEGGTGPEAPEA